jgi:hypothetical protein
VAHPAPAAQALVLVHEDESLGQQEVEVADSAPGVRQGVDHLGIHDGRDSGDLGVTPEGLIVPEAVTVCAMSLGWRSGLPEHSSASAWQSCHACGGTPGRCL